jgi:hypothetical protein
MNARERHTRHRPLVMLVCTWCAAGSFNADAEDALTNIVSNVRSNERLYANIEINLTKSYRDERPDTNLGMTVVKDYEETIRCIIQNKYTYYSAINQMKDTAGISSEYKGIIGDDGELTRLVHGTIVNYDKDRVDRHRLLNPHMLLLEYFLATPFPFSVYLGGDKETKVYDAFKDIHF